LTQSGFRGRAKADAKIMRPSRAKNHEAEAEAESLRPSQTKADGCRGKAKVRQAEKLLGAGLELRLLPRGLQSTSAKL